MQKNKSESHRSGRVASKVQTLVAQILTREYGEDSLLSGISIVGAEAHGGLQFVKLFYYSHNTDIDAVQKKLESVNKNIRFSLANVLNQKYVPEIRFVYDDTLDRASRIDELLKSIQEG